MGEILDRIPCRSFSGHIYLGLKLYILVPMEHLFYGYTLTLSLKMGQRYHTDPFCYKMQKIFLQAIL